MLYTVTLISQWRAFSFLSSFFPLVLTYLRMFCDRNSHNGTDIIVYSLNNAWINAPPSKPLTWWMVSAMCGQRVPRQAWTHSPARFGRAGVVNEPLMMDVDPVGGAEAANSSSSSVRCQGCLARIENWWEKHVVRGMNWREGCEELPRRLRALLGLPGMRTGRPKYLESSWRRKA